MTERPAAEGLGLARENSIREERSSIMMHSQGSIFRYVLALTMACLVALAGTTTALAYSSSSKTTTSATEATSQVDVNNASLKKLETLPGVSPALAKKIVSGRPYRNLSDLAQVKGMGQKKANALKGHVTFGAASGATTTKSAKRTHAKASSMSAGSYTTPSPTEESTTPSRTEENTAPSATESSSSSKPSASGSQLAPDQTVDINTASAEELDKLPGIGPAKAQAIVDYRNEHGDFKSIEDIKNVHGIKEGTFSKIKDYITVGQ